MPIYLVQHRSEAAERAVPEMDSALESLDVCVRPFPGTWIVEAALAAYQIETMLEPHLGANDQLLIVRLAQEGSWRNVSPDAHEFMDASFKRNAYGSVPPGH